VKELVERRWSEYGIDLPIETNGTRRRGLVPERWRSIRRG
jgi:hypothetical protein